MNTLHLLNLHIHQHYPTHSKCNWIAVLKIDPSFLTDSGKTGPVTNTQKSKDRFAPKSLTPTDIRRTFSAVDKNE